MSENVSDLVLENLVSAQPGSKAVFERLPLDLLGDVSVELQVVIGELTLTVAQLMALKAGDVLALDKTKLSPVDLLLNGVPVARGSLVVAGDRFAVRVESGYGGS